MLAGRRHPVKPALHAAKGITNLKSFAGSFTVLFGFSGGKDADHQIKSWFQLDYMTSPCPCLSPVAD